MHEFVLFVEDFAHKAFLEASKRLAENRVQIQADWE
jgi:hypothetical protein